MTRFRYRSPDRDFADEMQEYYAGGLCLVLEIYVDMRASAAATIRYECSRVLWSARYCLPGPPWSGSVEGSTATVRPAFWAG